MITVDSGKIFFFHNSQRPARLKCTYIVTYRRSELMWYSLQPLKYSFKLPDDSFKGIYLVKPKESTF